MIQYLILISSFSCIFSTPVPQSLDWRTKGAVLPVADLGDCGTPVIVNALDAISAQNQIKGRELVRLSAQQIYDCGKNNLCPCQDGASISQIYDLLWAEDLGDQIDSEESYPFTGKCTKQCNFKKSGAVVTMNAYTSCTDCIDPMNRTSEELLLGQLQQGPVPVQIQADTVSFQTYTGGIFDDASCTGSALDFALLVVGYGTENGVDYWIARNSWGTNWGEKGYIRIVRGKFMCGIGKVWAQPFVL